MKKYIILLILFCFFIFPSRTYSQEWIPIDENQKGETVSMEVLQSDALGYKVKVCIHGLNDNLVKNERGIFHLLTIDHGNNLLYLGKPSLPCLTQIIAIPSGADMSASIIERKWEEIYVDKIFPAQSADYEERASKGFIIDENAYQDVFSPDFVIIGQEHLWQGIRSVGVSVCPFRYYPHKNKLLVLSEFVLNVSFLNKETTKLQQDSSYIGMYSNTVYKEAESSLNNFGKSINNSDNYDYLIFVESTVNTNNTVFQESMQNFRMWKALKGLKTKVHYVTASEAYPEYLRNYINTERSKGIKYVLFVGDSGTLPLSCVFSFSGQSNYVFGDYWYGCNNDSTIADIPVGRFSISSTTDFVNMVKKTIKYECTYNCHGNALLIAHLEGAPYPDSYQGVSNQILNANYANPIQFMTAYGASTTYNGNNATNEYVLSRINYGDHIINYRGHGGNDSWGPGGGYVGWNYSSEIFESSQINNMDSTTCCVFFSVACNTGNIASSTDCMLETFTRSDHGAAAFIGATIPTYTGANNYYDKYIFGRLLNNNVFNVGNLNVLAHRDNILTFGMGTGNEYMAKDNAYAYICGGDPSLELWTDSPFSILNVNVTSENGYITVSSNLTSDYYISIVSNNGEVIDRIDCTSSTCSFPIPSESFFFSINKHNYRPYIAYYDTESEYIQNVMFVYDAYYKHNPLSIGYDVTLDSPVGEVVVKNGHKLILDNGASGVLIDSYFECEKGAVFEIK